METSPVLFIIGVGRSGTNLLSQILDGNPEINFPLEQYFLLRSYRQLYKKPFDEKAKAFFKNRLKKDVFLEKLWKIDLEKVNKHIDSLPEDIPFNELCNLVLTHRESLYTTKEKAHVYGYHNPRSTFHAENLMELFPNSKCIFLHRNALDNVSSFKNSQFFKGIVSVPFYAYRWKWYNNYCLKLCKKYPDKIYKLAYEDLVSDPEKKIKEICDLVNVPFDKNMLDFQEKFTPHYKENMFTNKYHVHAKMTEKINTKNIHSYKSNLSEEDIALISFLTNKTNVKLGYEAKRYKFRLKFIFSIFPAIRLMYRFDKYASLQSINNLLLPKNKFFRFNKPLKDSRDQEQPSKRD